MFLGNKFYLRVTPTWVVTDDGSRVKGWTGRWETYYQMDRAGKKPSRALSCQILDDDSAKRARPHSCKSW